MAGQVALVLVLALWALVLLAALVAWSIYRRYSAELTTAAELARMMGAAQQTAPAGRGASSDPAATAAAASSPPAAAPSGRPGPPPE